MTDRQTDRHTDAYTHKHTHTHTHTHTQTDKSSDQVKNIIPFFKDIIIIHTESFIIVGTSWTLQV